MESQLLELLEYNFWANDQFILRLKDQEDLPTRIPELMSHILSAHQLWLGRIAARGTLPSAWSSIVQNNWEELNIEMYNETTDVVKSHSPDTRVSYTTSKGEHCTSALHSILYHLINHSTHHRAQVALLMRQHGILPPESDLIFYLRN